MKKAIILLMMLLPMAGSAACSADSPSVADAGNAAAPTVQGTAPMSGTVNLWYSGRIPAVTRNVNNSDGPDFVPNMEVFTIDANATPKGAVVICPGGAFMFRSIALVGFSAGGILNGEVLLNWRGTKNASSLDSSYRPDELDAVPVEACGVGMVYAFYGRLSVSMNNVATLRAANLPPAFYCWGTRDSFAGQFTQNSTAVSEAGCQVVTHVLQGYPHGYGTGGSPSVWGEAFDAFLTPIMERNMASVAATDADSDKEDEEIYSLNGMRVRATDELKGVYIVKSNKGTQKIIK